MTGLKLLSIALLYTSLAKLVLTFFADAYNVTLVWLPSGLGLATLLLAGRHYWPGIFIGATLVGLSMGDSFPTACGIAIGNTLESWLAATWLSRNSGFSPQLQQARDFIRLMIAGIAAAGASATIGPISLLMQGSLPLNMLTSSMLHWWMADIFGITLVTPLILIWRYWPRDWFTLWRLPETLAFFSLSLVSGQSILIHWLPLMLDFYAQGYWTFLLIVWAAIRFGRHGVMLLITMVAVQSLWGLQHHTGPFASGQMQMGLMDIWLYLLVLGCVGIPLTLVLFEHEKTTLALKQSQAHLFFALESINTGAWELDLSQQIFHTSPIFSRIFGQKNRLLRWHYQQFIEQVLPAYRDEVEAGFSKACREHSDWNFECKIRRSDGDIRWIRGSGRHAADNAMQLTGIIQDTTDYKVAEEDRQLAMLFYQNCSEAMMITEIDATIISVNPAFTRVTGYTAEDIIGKNARILGSGRHDPSFFNDMWNTINNFGRWRGEVWNRRKNGELYVEQLSINTICDHNGEPLRRIGLFFDITQRKLSEEQLWKQANFDPLTGIGNRRMFYDRLNQETEKAQRNNSQLALIIVDLENFKAINDKLGYNAGDNVLLEVTQRLLRCVNESDMLARLDGTEFAIIRPNIELSATVKSIAQQLLQTLCQPYEIGHESMTLSCRIGIAIHPSDNSDASHLRRQALQAVKRCPIGAYLIT